MTKIYLVTISYAEHYELTAHAKEGDANKQLFEHIEANWPADLDKFANRGKALSMFRLHVVGVYGSFDIDELDLPPGILCRGCEFSMQQEFCGGCREDD